MGHGLAGCVEGLAEVGAAGQLEESYFSLLTWIVCLIDIHCFDLLRSDELRFPWFLFEWEDLKLLFLQVVHYGRSRG